MGKAIYLLAIQTLIFLFYNNDLENTKWHVVIFYKKSENKMFNNTSNFPDKCELHFKKNRLEVKSCNGYEVSYKTSKDTLTLWDGPPGLQAAFCGSGFSNNVEEFILKNISNKMTYLTKSDTLSIYTSDSSYLRCVKYK